MSKKLKELTVASAIMFMALLFGLLVFAGPMSEVPELDEYTLRVVEDMSLAVEEMKIGEFDFLGLDTDAQIESLDDAGFDIHWTTSYSYASVIIDMRDYKLECGGPSDNLPNTPLNYSNFRLALHKILGYEFWENANALVVGTRVFPHDLIVFDASADYCASNDPVPGGNPKFGGPTLPFSTLIEGTTEDPGAREYLMQPFDIDPYPFSTKHTGDTKWMNPENVGAFTIEDGKLKDPNGNVVRQMSAKYYAADITDITMWEEWIVPTLNEAFYTLGVREGPAGESCPDNYPFYAIAQDWGTLVTDVAEFRDYDIAYMGWGLSHRPDWLHGLFTSEQAVCWGYNDPGLGPETTGSTVSDDLLYTIHTSLDVDEVKDACYWFQYYCLYEWTPLIIMSNTYTVAATGHGTAGVMTTPLLDVVESPGYGSGTSRTWQLVNWGGASSPYETELVKRRTYAVASELNLLIADETVDYLLLNPINDEGLLTIDYETLEDVPYIAKDWKITYWSWPEIGVTDGMKITYWLRDDVYWHDGYKLTSEDVAFAFSMLIKHKPPPRTDIWRDLIYVEPEGPNKVNLYYDATGVYQLFNAAANDAGLSYPKRILERVDKDYENPFLWEPNTISYEDWFPEGPMPGFEPPEGIEYKLLIGLGPYIFDYMDETIGMERLVKNPNYWRGTLTCAVDPFGDESEGILYRIEPETGVAHYEVTVCNYDNEDATDLEVRIYEDGEQVHTETIDVKRHNYERFGDYTFGPFEKATTHTILVEVYDDGVLECSYEQVVHATIKEDINLDGKVDILDIAAAAAAFGSNAVPAHPRWNPTADIDHNFKIDILDIASIALNFAWPAA